MLFEEYLTEPFGTLSKLISIHAGARGKHLALVSGDRSLSYGELDRQATLVAATFAAPWSLPGRCSRDLRDRITELRTGVHRQSCAPAPWSHHSRRLQLPIA